MVAAVAFLLLLSLLGVCDARRSPARVHGESRALLAPSMNSHDKRTTTQGGRAQDKSFNHSSFANGTRLSDAHKVMALGNDCGRPEVAAALGCWAVYDDVAYYGKSQAAEAKRYLAASGYKLSSLFLAGKGKCLDFKTQKPIEDSDAAHLWKRKSDDHCLLVFRGSNCNADGFIDNPAHIFKYGHDIHQGVLMDEFEPLLAKMAEADFTDCKTLDVTGHSLGGSLASIFAVLSNDGKLKLKKYVDAVHLFAPAKVFFGDSGADGQTKDGCFPGATYCFYGEKSGQFLVDLVCHAYAGYQPVKTGYVKLGATTGTTSCQAKASLLPTAPPGGWDLHDMPLYLSALGCSTAQIQWP